MSLSESAQIRPSDQARWSIDAATSVWLSTIVVGLAMVAAKIIKLGFQYTRLYSTWKIVGVAAAIVASAVLIGAFVYAMRDRLLRMRMSGLTIGLFLVGAWLLVEAAAVVSTGSFYFVAYRAIAVFRWDAVALGVLSFFFFSITRLGGTRLTISKSVVIWATAYVLTLLISLDVAYFVTSGSTGNWFLLQYAFQQWHFVGAPIIAEGGAFLWAIVAVPLLLSAIVWLIWKVIHRTGRLGHTSWRRPKWHAVAYLFAATVTIALLWPERFLEDEYRVQTSNLFFALASDIVDLPSALDNPPSAIDPEDVPFYAADVIAEPRTESWQGRHMVVFVLESARAASAPPFNRDGAAMPFLNGISKESLVARRMYTSVPFTAEALVAMLHGVHPPSTGWDFYGNIRKPAVPALLRSAGYKTAFYTSAELSTVRREEEMLRNMGFDQVQSAKTLPSEGFESLLYTGFEDRIMLGPAVEWAKRQQASEQPFFMVMLTQQAHHDYRVPAAFKTTDFQTGIPELEAYLNALAYSDRFLENMVRSLATDSTSNSPIFVFVGDHGQAFGEHGFRFHGHHVWEEVIRVPFIVYDPQASKGGEIGGPYQLVDVFPTVLDLLDLRLQGEFRGGRSLLSDGPRDKVYVPASANQAMSLLTDSLKYIYTYRREPMKVFDLGDDELEEIDLGDGLSKEDKAAIEIELLTWRRMTNDYFDLPAVASTE
ncbi:MAG: sulfatase-like hydrolase/transferase [Rhodothermia bacterium]|nr:sulfatase-like hydrolase/transferase [Rhodothermia bacterium]